MIRDRIYEDIMKHGWNVDQQTFVQYYGNTTLDASTLMLPLMGFLSPTDPRFLKTLDAISEPPHKGGLLSNNLVYRYNVETFADGLVGKEGTSNL